MCHVFNQQKHSFFADNYNTINICCERALQKERCQEDNLNEFGAKMAARSEKENGIVDCIRLRK